MLGDNGFQALADHQLEDVTRCDVLPGGVDGRLEALLAAVALDIWKLLGLRIPGQGINQGEGSFHAAPELCNPRHGGLPGCIFRLALAEISEGHGCDLALHLIEDQNRVHQHPDAIGWVRRLSRMHRNTGFNPLNQLVAPDAVELTKGWQAGQADAVIRLKTAAQAVEGVAVECVLAAITPASLQAVVAG